MKKIFFNTKANWICAGIVLFLILLANLSLFKVKEYEQAATFVFGEFSREYKTPGLKCTYPWARKYKVDIRLQLHTTREMTLQEETKKNLLVDYFTLYKMESPYTFFTQVDGDLIKAIHRLDDNTSSDVSAVLGESSFNDIVTNRRQDILDSIKMMSNRGLEDIALKIYFMSFNRVELPNENKIAVFNDMISNRNKIASQYRSEGQMYYDSIKSHADFLVNDILAIADRQADSIMGRADKEAIAIRNKGYAQSAPLFKIYNEIETYKLAYGTKTKWIIEKKNMLKPPSSN